MSPLPDDFRPMLAARELSGETKDKLRYPLWGSPKLDGIRALVIPGEGGKPVLVSRTLRPIRSAYAQRMFAREEYLGFDGELVFGEPNDPQVFNKTTSAVMTIGSEEPVRFYVFDICYPLVAAKEPYTSRLENLSKRVAAVNHPAHLLLVVQHQLNSWEAVLSFERQILALGFEGIILRDPDTPYKYNRATLKGGNLVKLKRLEDGEAEVIGFVELLINQNTAILDALGYQKRSSSLEGKVPGNRLGALQVRDIHTGVEFEIGSGFDDALRCKIWDNQEQYLGKIVSYKHFPIGAIDRPRQPIFKGFRDKEDIS